MNRSLVIAATLALGAAPAFAKPAHYEIDPAHSSAEFVVRHMEVSNVRGQFTKVSGSATFDPENPANDSVEATVDATTINTHEEKRDAHLKSPDFFDVAKFPTLTFKSKKVWKDGGRLKMTGDLTMHGVTKEVTWMLEGPSKPQKTPWGNTVVGVTAVTKVNRGDFGLKWNKAIEGGNVVGEEVNIGIEVEMTEQAPKSAAAAPKPAK